MTIALWILCVVLILVGLAGVVLPALPGTVFVLAGIVLGAWIDGFARVGPGMLALIATLAALAWAADYAAGLIGAQRVGASRAALIGAALGTVAGLFMGLVGVFFMPIVGASLGEWWARRDRRRAVSVGASTGLGIVLGVLVKLALTFVMIGLFVVALLA